MAELSYSELLEDTREAFNSRKTRSRRWRESQLRAIVQLLEENQEKLINALQADLGKDRYDSLTDEILFCRNEANWFLNNLGDLMKDKKIPLDLLNAGGKAYLRSQPYGVVLNISAWNYPVQLAMSPLSSIVAAGNCCVFKPSELSPATSNVLAELFPRYFDNECIKLIQGGIPETTALLKLRFDHIMYTGSSQVAKIIYRAASEHLTPCTLELGGKCPTYVDENCNMEAVANRITWSKFKNAGQTCLANDYILVHEAAKDEFIVAMKKAIQEMYGTDPSKSPDYSKIVNERHFKRICDLMDSSRTKHVELGGTRELEKRYISPTLLTGVLYDDKIMQEEIFGPLLPILTVQNYREAIEVINEREKPLHLYVFTKSQVVIDAIVEETSSGGVTVNDCLIASVLKEFPFGGVGNSGMGFYHGKPGFQNFSHQKPVLVKTQAMEWIFKLMRYSPHSEKKQKWITWMTSVKPTSPVKKIVAYVLPLALLAVLVTTLASYFGYIKTH